VSVVPSAANFVARDIAHRLHNDARQLKRRMWTGSSRPGLLCVLSACRMVSGVLVAAGNQPQAAAAGMTRL
jgi:hypothetical protein